MQRHRREMIQRSESCSILREAVMRWRGGELTFEEAATKAAIGASVSRACRVEEITRLRAEGLTESATWPTTLSAFVDVMERKLEENQHKGGWRTGNMGGDLGYLMGRLNDELEELRMTALTHPLNPEAIAGECADVANFAMMIADVVGGLEEKT